MRAPAKVDSIQTQVPLSKLPTSYDRARDVQDC